MSTSDPPGVAGDVWVPPVWLGRLGGTSWRLLVVFALAAVVVGAVMALSVVILPAFLALLFATVLLPLDRRLRGWGARPALAAFVAVAALVALLVALGWAVVRAVADQWGEIGVRLDAGVERLVGDGGADEAAAADISSGVAAVARLLLEGALTLLPVVATVVGTLLLTLFVAFFYVKDGHRMWAWVVDASGATGALVDGIGRRVWVSVQGFVLGQTAVAAVDAILISLGALLLGVPEVAAIATITFLGAYVPYIGATVAGSVAVLLALSEGGTTDALLMLGVVLLVQALEGNVFQPWIQARTVRLHPVVVGLSVVAGGALAGFLGVFLSVPLAAAAVASLAELRAAGYLGTTVAPAPTPAPTPAVRAAEGITPAG